MFIEVSLPLPFRHNFYYRCSLFEFEQIQPGQRILVPFKNRKLTGYVVKKHSQINFPDSLGETEIKAVLDVLDGGSLVSPQQLRLAEWVADYYAPYSEADQEDPNGPLAGVTRAMRGGSWNGSYADWVRPTFRFHDVAETRSHGIGFRCARDL